MGLGRMPAALPAPGWVGVGRRPVRSDSPNFVVPRSTSSICPLNVIEASSARRSFVCVTPCSVSGGPPSSASGRLLCCAPLRSSRRARAYGPAATGPRGWPRSPRLGSLEGGSSSSAGTGRAGGYPRWSSSRRAPTPQVSHALAVAGSAAHRTDDRLGRLVPGGGLGGVPRALGRAAQALVGRNGDLRLGLGVRLSHQMCSPLPPRFSAGGRPGPSRPGTPRSSTCCTPPAACCSPRRERNVIGISAVGVDHGMTSGARGGRFAVPEVDHDVASRATQVLPVTRVTSCQANDRLPNDFTIPFAQLT